jgi:hypothetical protein
MNVHPRTPNISGPIDPCVVRSKVEWQQPRFQAAAAASFSLLSSGIAGIYEAMFFIMYSRIEGVVLALLPFEMYISGT